MRISDWSSDVCSSDLGKKSSCYVRKTKPTEIRCYRTSRGPRHHVFTLPCWPSMIFFAWRALFAVTVTSKLSRTATVEIFAWNCLLILSPDSGRQYAAVRSEEHTSELQSLMRISYAVFCLKKKTTQ